MVRKKRRPLRFEALELRQLLAADISMIRYYETWTGSTIHSTDPAGIGYHAPSGHLFLADSEIEELGSKYFVGDNIFEISTKGDTVYRRIASKNIEPTGITYNDFDGYFYVSNDDTHLITRYDSRLNTPLKSVDSTKAGVKDPEDIAADPDTGTLYVANGVSGGNKVAVYNANLEFQRQFSVSSQVHDGEGIAFDPVSKNVFIVSTPDMAVFEFTTTGTFIHKYSLSGFSPRPQTPQGAVFAPTSSTSDDPTALALYIVDGGIDNHPSGRVYETLINGGSGGTGGGGGGGGGGTGNQTLDVQIATSSDDAEEKNGSVSTTNGDLELVYDGGNQTVGLRFGNISVPRGATILNATVQFTVDETSSESTSLKIRGQAIDNALTFTTLSSNISSRSRTSSEVSWSPAAWTSELAAGAAQKTPNLSSIIKEIIDRPGWNQGNALALILTGTGRRVAESYEGGANYAAKLHIEYQTGTTPTNTPPQVDAGLGAAIPFGAIAHLDATVVDNGGPSPLTTTWSLVSTTGSGTVTFGNTNAIDTTASFSATGSYVLKLTATDGEFTSTDEVTIQVTEGADGFLDVRVASSSDDAEEYPDGFVDLTSSDLELVFDKYNQTVGMRFNGIAIPMGATIVNAYVQFEVDEVSTSGTTALLIEGQDADNALTFTKTSKNISSRPRTSVSIPWTPAVWPTVQVAGFDQQTPNLSGIIQQIVNRTGWALGNSLAILISGTGKRVAEAYDGRTTAPLLHVEYTLPPPSPMAAPITEPSISVSKRATASTAFVLLAPSANGPTEASTQPSDTIDPASTDVLQFPVSDSSERSSTPPRLTSIAAKKPAPATDLLARNAFFASMGE